MRFSLLFGVVTLFYGCSAQLLTAPGTASSCLPYGVNCINSNVCCFYPSVLCLPDTKNATSCLSILDVVNLNPSISGTNLLAPLLTAVGNSSTATGALQEVVKVNNNTVYNLTEIITPSSTVIYGGNVQG